MTSQPPDALESLVGEIADEFTRRHHRGEGPRVEEYADRYPELAGLLREILPAIQALGPTAGGAVAETPHTRETAGGGAAVPVPVPADDYEVLGEVGRGGMGVVYKARHRKLGRVVALKVLRSDAAADLARFRGEAQAVARLQHPNVVQIFEVREAGGRPLLALEFVAGGTLAERVKGEPQPPRQAAALVRTLARAIAAAHDRELVHRDLKPSNILLAVDDDIDPPAAGRALDSLVPKISDFGLAKRLDEDVGQTQTGAIVGTPSYMAPEQAIARGPVGPAADIYALGAILYELVTGRPPFKGPSALETLELVRNAEPTPPTQLQPGCPRDLETICLKCLRKESAARYPTAAALADDLQRFLDGAPIHARPVGGVERLGKWLRRRPAVAASIGLGSLAALAVVALAVRLAYSWELEDVNRKLGEAVGERDAALVVADEAQAKLDAALDRERALHYVHSINLAQREWQANRVDEARRLLDACPPDLRHWEWYYLHRQCHAELVAIHGHVGPITALAVSPDGNLIAGASQTMADTTPIAFDLKVWDATSGKLTRELFGHQAVTVGVAFSPDGTLLASTSNDKTIRLWEVRSGREVLKITTNVVARRVAFSPDGTRLAAVAGPQILFFDAERGTELFGLSGHTGNVFVLAFSADGQRLVTAGADRLVKVWDLATRKEAFSCRGHTGEIADVAFSPKKDQIISSGRGSGATVRRGEVRLWSAADGKPAPVNMTLPFPVTGAGFTANPGQIACAGLDGDVRFLDATRGTTTFTLHGQSAAVRNLVVTRDGTRVVTGLSDRTIRVWSVRNPEFVELPLNMSAFVPLAFSPDGTRLAGNYFDLEAKRNPPRGVQVVAVSPGAPGPVDIRPTKGTVAALSFAPDRRWLAGAELTGVHLWERDNLAASRFLAEFGVWDLSVSPDGQYLATATRDPDVDPRPDLGDDFMTNIVTMRTRLAIPPQQTVPAIKVWRVADGGLEYSLPGQMSVSFSPDGRHVAGARANTVVLWDATTGQELRTLSGPTEPVLKVQFTATGRRVAGFTYHRATVWDTHTGRIMAAVDGLKGPAFITPDGRRIVDLHGGSTIKWWDVQLGRELLFLPLPEGSARALAIALSADGRRVATSSGNKLFLWEAGPP